LHIRPATTNDAQAIAEIWNQVIRDSAATFTNIEKSVPALQDMILERTHMNYGFYMAETPDRIAGFATYGPFRSGPGYAQTMEHSVFLNPDERGKGTGKALMNALEEHGRTAGIHSFIAGLSAENINGILFHAALGYNKVADIKQAGFKFGRWHDLILMQRFL
jgi:L-amino acid N-acyltransferase